MLENYFKFVSFPRAAACIASVYLVYLAGFWVFMAAQPVGFIDGTQAASYIMLGLLATDGTPVYLPFNSAEQISHLYGPLTFWPLGYATRWFDNPAIGAHVFGVARGAVALALFAAAVKKISSSSTLAVVATSCIAAIYGKDLWNYLQDGTVFWGLALFAFARTLPPTPRVVCAAVGIFAAFSAKATAPLYFLPLFWALFGMKKQTPPTFCNVAESGIAALLAIFWAILLFVHPSFEMKVYWNILTGVGVQRDIEFYRIIKNIFAFLAALSPLAAAMWCFRIIPFGGKMFSVIAVAAALPLIFYVAALEGANPNHIRHFSVAAWIAAAGLAATPNAEPKIKRAKILLALACIAVFVLQENMWRRAVLPWLYRDSSMDLATLAEIKAIKEPLSGYSRYSTGYCNWVYECPHINRLDNAATWIFRGALHGANYHHFIEITAQAALNGAIRHRGQKAPPVATWDFLRGESVEVFVIPVPSGKWVRSPAPGEWAKIFHQHYHICGRSKHLELFCASRVAPPKFL